MAKLITYLLLFCSPAVVIAGVQHATISALEVNPSKARTGASCYNVSGTISFEHSMGDFRKAGDSLAKSYILTIKFKEGAKPVSVNTGYNKLYSDESGALTLIAEKKLSADNLYNYDFAFSVATAAFNLPEGKHSLTPLISLADDNNTSILHNEKLASVGIYVLPTMKIRLWVKHILVDSLDAEGNLWDYFVFNPIESNPDIVWSLNYAGRAYFRSKMAKNSFDYFDLQHSQTYDIIISKGDIISIEVKDVDDLTPDDIIGTIIIIPEEVKQKNESTVISKAGQIKSLEYVLAVLP